MTLAIWEGPTVRLRAIEPDDWQDFHTNDVRDTEGARHSYFIPLPRSQEAARQWAADQGASSTQGDSFSFAIETLDNILVGTISVQQCDRRNGTFWYGIGIFPPYQGKGYAGEAIPLVLAYYFRELRYQKVNVRIYAFNQASLRLHERLGFSHEGRLRRTHYTAGTYHDEILMGMTAEEFDTRWPGAR